MDNISEKDKARIIIEFLTHAHIEVDNEILRELFYTAMYDLPDYLNPVFENPELTMKIINIKRGRGWYK